MLKSFATSSYGVAVHSACKGFGYTLDEWDDNEEVDPLVRYYHEVAEYVMLSRQGGMEPVLPLTKEDDEEPDNDKPKQQKSIRR